MRVRAAGWFRNQRTTSRPENPVAPITATLISDIKTYIYSYTADADKEIQGNDRAQQVNLNQEPSTTTTTSTTTTRSTATPKSTRRLLAIRDQSQFEAMWRTLDHVAY